MVCVGELSSQLQTLDFKQQVCNANAEKSPVCQPRAPTPGLRAGPLALFRSLMIACSEGGRRNDAKGGRCHTPLRTLARLLQKLNARRRRRSACGKLEVLAVRKRHLTRMILQVISQRSGATFTYRSEFE